MADDIKSIAALIASEINARPEQVASAVELLDRRSLRSVQDKPGMPAWVAALSEQACALLIESRAASIRAKGLLQPLVAIVRGAPYAAWSLLR